RWQNDCSGRGAFDPCAFQNLFVISIALNYAYIFHLAYRGDGFFVGLDDDKMSLRFQQFIDDAHAGFARTAHNVMSLQGLNYSAYTFLPEVVGQIPFHDERSQNRNGIEMDCDPQHD